MGEDNADRERKGLLAKIAIAIVLIGITVAVGLYASGNLSPVALRPDAEAGEPAQDGHVHDWTAEYELRDVPASTHTVHHEAQYGTETVYETVCNECQAVITGEAEEHGRQTGHAGFSTDVPVVNEVVVREAYDETIVDKPASVQLVHTSDRCASCDAVRDVEDEIVKEDVVGSADAQ